MHVPEALFACYVLFSTIYHTMPPRLERTQPHFGLLFLRLHVWEVIRTSTTLTLDSRVAMDIGCQQCRDPNPVLRI